MDRNLRPMRVVLASKIMGGQPMPKTIFKAAALTPGLRHRRGERWQIS
jgi:hypothetical protein